MVIQVKAKLALRKCDFFSEKKNNKKHKSSIKIYKKNTKNIQKRYFKYTFKIPFHHNLINQNHRLYLIFLSMPQ